MGKRQDRSPPEPAWVLGSPSEKPWKPKGNPQRERGTLLPHPPSNHGRGHHGINAARVSAFAPQKRVLRLGKPRTCFCGAKADSVARCPTTKLGLENPKRERGTLPVHACPANRRSPGPTSTRIANRGNVLTARSCFTQPPKAKAARPRRTSGFRLSHFMKGWLMGLEPTTLRATI